MTFVHLFLSTGDSHNLENNIREFILRMCVYANKIDWLIVKCTNIGMTFVHLFLLTETDQNLRNNIRNFML